MKKLTLAALLLTIVTGGFTQSTFKNNYSISTDYLEWDKALELSDGSLCMLGYHEAYDGETYNDLGTMVKLNSNGDVLLAADNNFSYSSVTGYDYIYSGQNTADGNFAVAGQSNSQGFLAKFDLNFNNLWEKQYSIANENSAVINFFPTSEHGFLIGLQHGQNTNTDALIKTDSLGNILWNKRYQDYGVDNNMEDIKKCTDGNYIFTDLESKVNILVVKTDTAGNVLWSKHILSPGAFLGYMFLTCSPTGSIYLSATLSTTQMIDGVTRIVYLPVLIKLNGDDGSMVWSKQGNVTKQLRWYNRAITTDKSGDIIMGGELDDRSISPESDQNYLYRMDTLGNLISSRQYVAAGGGYMYDMISLSDSTFFAVGTGDDADGNYTSFGYKIGKDLSDCGELKDSSVVFSDMGLTADDFELSPVDAGVTALAADSDISTTPATQGASVCTVLPVHLTSFTAALDNGAVHLQWKTASEQNASYYAVERSADINNSFAPLKKISARNLLTAQTYNSVDEDPLPGTSYYRLRSVDADGKSTLSKVVPISISATGTIYISPNPIGSALKVHINATAAVHLTLQVTDLAGKVLLTQNKSISAGANTISLPATFSKGMYILKVLENGKQHALKFMK